MPRIISLLSFSLLLAGSAALATDTVTTTTKSTTSKMSQMSTKPGDMKAAITTVKTECDADMKKLCSDITPGDGEMAACLNSKIPQLTTSCREAQMALDDMIFKKMDRSNVAFRKNCGQDLKKWCETPGTDEAGVWSCLNEHTEELSSKCKSMRNEVDRKFDQSIG
jgi:hypothetical protein